MAFKKTSSDKTFNENRYHKGIEEKLLSKTAMTLNIKIFVGKKNNKSVPSIDGHFLTSSIKHIFM